MMTNTSRHNELSYYLFLDELESLLQNSDITPSRQRIRAEADSQKNWSEQPLGKRSAIVGRVIIYIEEHLTESLSLDDLAKEARLSKYQLIRGFREERGITPWKYLIGERIEKAKELLEEGRSPGQVAVESGFYDQPHFSKTFRDETGRTPTEYQQENFRNKN